MEISRTLDVGNIPATLQHVPQWVCWHWKQVDGKPKKPPLNPRGGNARVDNPDTWGGLDAALQRARNDESVAGVGFVLTGGDEFVVVDLDHCITGGEIEQRAQDIIDQLDSYTEYSPSGTGVHVWVRGQLPDGGRRQGGVEIYADGRYVTVTGWHVPGTPGDVHERTPQLQALHANIFGAEAESSTSSTGGGATYTNGSSADSAPPEDEWLWERMFSSRNGDEIQRLYDGEIVKINPAHPDSRSESVLALCNHLAFYTGKDPARMDRMFRQSGQYREKWERLGPGTIEKAIATTPNSFDPTPHLNGSTYTNGSTPQDIEPAPQRAGLQQLLDELEAQENSSDVERWAADNVRPATQLPPDERQQLRVAIKQQWGDDKSAEKYLEKQWDSTIKETWAYDAKKNQDNRPLSEQMFDALQHPALGYTFRLNQLEDTVEVNGERMDDILRSKILLQMKDDGFPKTYVEDAINTLADSCKYHPVKEYLESLQWDGENHFYGFAAFLLGDGSEVHYNEQRSEPFVKVAFYRWMLGCVATALDGADMDAFQHQNPMLVLIGAQGKGKSTLVRWLCSGLGPRYYRESPLNPHSTDDVRSMVTKWIWEVSELGASLRRADREALKSFITTQQFTYRKPYARYDITKPKLCSLVGTLNPDGSGFLDDPSGHRRYIPVVLNGIDYRYKEMVDVDQLWAQIVHEYRKGARPELTPAEREVLAQIHQQNEVDNPLETYINRYFEIDPENELWRTHTSTIIDRLRSFGVSLPNNVRVAGKEIAEVLTGMGLHNNGNIPFRSDGALGRGWYGITPNSRETPSR